MIREDDIRIHLGSTKQIRPRWKVSSEEILESTYLQKVGIVAEDAEDDGHIRLKGVCLQVSHPGEEPFTIDVILRKPLPGKIEMAKCSCTAGASGKCKHTTALLKHISVNSEIEPWTCTTGACSWKNELKSVQENVLHPIPLTDFCHHVKKLEPLKEIQNFFESSVYADFSKYIPNNCSFKKFMNGRGTKTAADENRKTYEFPFVLTQLYDEKNDNVSLQELVLLARNKMNICLTVDDIKNIEQLTRGQAKNKLWFLVRIGRVTGSVVGIVMKVRSYNSNMTVFKRICYPTKLSTPAIRWGRKHENDALDLYKMQFNGHSNLKVESVGFFVHEKHNFLGASPDAIAVCDCCPRRVVEVKCPYSVSEEGKSLLTLDYVEDQNGTFKLKENHTYFYQIQLQMLCAGVDFCDFVIWTPHEHLILRYPRNIDICNKILEKSEYNFYNAIMPELLSKFHTRNSNK